MYPVFFICICLFYFLVLLGGYADTFPLVFILQPTTKQADGVSYNNICIFLLICVFIFVFIFVFVFVLAWVCCGHISISLHIAAGHRTSKSSVPGQVIYKTKFLLFFFRCTICRIIFWGEEQILIFCRYFVDILELYEILTR